jgi:DnaJ-class molecular chaperone
MSKSIFEVYFDKINQSYKDLNPTINTQGGKPKKAFVKVSTEDRMAKKHGVSKDKLCGHCYGTGKIKDEDKSDTNRIFRKACPSCEGKGHF